MIRLIPLGALAVLLLVACGGESAVEVRPIEPILAGPIEIVADPTSTTASLRVDTTIPVACSVIYGTDETFGRIAVDSDMQGGAHQDHSPRLTGLRPDTDYVYVLQGSDSSGNLYRSEPMTFRTPAAEARDSGPNLSTGATVSAVSSEFSTGFAAGNAIDGDIGTEWSTAGDGDDAWIEIDLGQTATITGVGFNTRRMTDGSSITEIFSVTIDGMPVGSFDADGAVLFDPPIQGRLVRVDAEQTTGGNTGAVEIEIYG